MPFQPVPSYAEVSYSYYDEKTRETKSKFNPVWLSWFLSLNSFATSGVVTNSTLLQYEVIVGGGETSIQNLGSSGNVGDVLTSQGAAALPLWAPGGITSTILDSLYGTARGTIITRTAAGWVGLTPGAAGTKLTSNGAGADLTWV